jgi:hypothetical protein
MSNPIPEQISKRLLILVPKPDARVTPIKGSAIITSNPDKIDELVRVDFEGNIYNSEYYKTFWLRLFHAAGRHTERYPTVAREFHKDGPDFPYITVGIFNYPEAIRLMRTRTEPQDQAIAKACAVEDQFQGILEQWAGDSLFGDR